MTARAALAGIAMLAAGAFATQAAAEEPIDVDTALVFLSDISRSMDAHEIKLTREAHAVAINAPETLQAIRDASLGRVALTYVEFADGAWQRVDWLVVDGEQSALTFAAQVLSIPTGAADGTIVATGLELAAALIDRMPYRPLRIVVDVMGDGIEAADASRLRLNQARDALVDRGAVVNGLALIVRPQTVNLAEAFETHVIGGPGSFVERVHTIEDLFPALRRKVAQELF